MWTPSEIRRLIAQLAGVGFGIGGFMLLKQGVQASGSGGSINISAAFLSGHIESGSAGILLLFMGAMLIALPIFWHSSHPNTTQTRSINDGSQIIPLKPNSRLIRIVLSTVFTGILSLALLGGGQLLQKAGYEVGVFFMTAGVFAAMWTAGSIIWVIDVWTSESKEK